MLCLEEESIKGAAEPWVEREAERENVFLGLAVERREKDIGMMEVRVRELSRRDGTLDRDAPRNAIVTFRFQLLRTWSWSFSGFHFHCSIPF